MTAHAQDVQPDGDCAGASAGGNRDAAGDYAAVRVAPAKEKKYGLATACIGGGQGIAMIVESLN